jgi:uncharacterized protein (TIGR00369 family)
MTTASDDTAMPSKMRRGGASGCSCAYASLLEEGETFTTLELKANFLKPVWGGLLTARARVVKSGRTIGLVECDVLDAAESLVARASSTCMALREEAAAGRSA